MERIRCHWSQPWWKARNILDEDEQEDDEEEEEQRVSQRVK
jgi:hypothetical protein